MIKSSTIISKIEWALLDINPKFTPAKKLVFLEDIGRHCEDAIEEIRQEIEDSEKRNEYSNTSSGNNQKDVILGDEKR